MIDRRPMIAGNWKMNMGVDEAAALVKAISEGVKNVRDVEVLIAPPFTLLGAVREAIGGSAVFLGAQNMHWELSGAFTGEISGRMLQESGCTHVILGHSERRSLFGETNDDIDRKAKTAVLLGLIPVICIGETLEERETGRTFKVIRDQLDRSLANFIKDGLLLPSTILAYEPVWAIGTGKTATPDQAQEVHSFIRKWVADSFNTGTAEHARILYGGSVKPSNIQELMAQTDIDGALVGGASLTADNFVPIVCYK